MAGSAMEVKGFDPNIWIYMDLYMLQYLHLRVLKFPLNGDGCRLLVADAKL